jgi:hypothetical protein
LALNLQSSCFSFLSAGITGLYHPEDSYIFFQSLHSNSLSDPPNLFNYLWNVSKCRLQFSIQLQSADTPDIVHFQQGLRGGWAL